MSKIKVDFAKLIGNEYMFPAHVGMNRIMPRFFLDKRAGCAAVRDSQHPKYNKNYQGLHSDTPDVVEYIQGYHDKRWGMRPEDIEYLKNYCASLNKTQK